MSDEHTAEKEESLLQSSPQSSESSSKVAGLDILPFVLLMLLVTVVLCLLLLGWRYWEQNKITKVLQGNDLTHIYQNMQKLFVQKNPDLLQLDKR